MALPIATLDLLDRFAKRHGCTRAVVVAMALDALTGAEGVP
jgi:hypothetical protein